MPSVELNANLLKALGSKIRSVKDDDDELMMHGPDGSIAIMQNHIYFYSEISSQSILRMNNLLVKMMKEHLGEAASKNKEPDKIYLHLNTPGGTASSGFLGYDIIRSIISKVPVVTIIEGICASAGTFLSLAGSRRLITPSSNMVIHELSTIMGGTSSQIMEEYQNMLKVKTRIENLYCKHSNFKPEEIEDFLKRDTLMIAEEALEHGLVDEIQAVVF